MGISFSCAYLRFLRPLRDEELAAFAALRAFTAGDFAGAAFLGAFFAAFFAPNRPLRA